MRKFKKWQKQLLSLVATAVLVFLASLIFGEEAIWSWLGEEKNLSPEQIITTTTPVTVATNSTSREIADQEWELATVARVVDGDTVELADGRKVRYIGIDTPETKDPRREVGCFGQEASQRNEELVLNREIWLEKDVSDTDRYDRYLRYLWLQDEQQQWQMVNEILVSEGYAKASTYPPDVKYTADFKALEQQAREQNQGLWNEANCPN